MAVNLILAVDRGNAIGWADGRLPWRLSGDMKRFKTLTMGSTVVMGYNTFVSLNKLNGLPGRKNIVLTRKNHLDSRHLFGDEIDIISSLDWVARHNHTDTTTWIIGGASVYAEAIQKQMVDELYVTIVHESSGADVTLPFELVAWKRFILNQAALGVHWDLIEMETPAAVPNEPTVTYITLRKSNV